MPPTGNGFPTALATSIALIGSIDHVDSISWVPAFENSLRMVLSFRGGIEYEVVAEGGDVSNASNVSATPLDETSSDFRDEPFALLDPFDPLDSLDLSSKTTTLPFLFPYESLRLRVTSSRASDDGARGSSRLP